MHTKNFISAPLLYLINTLTSHLDTDISDDLSEIREWDKINPCISLEYLNNIKHMTESHIDSGKLFVYDGSVLEKDYKGNIKRIVRYRPAKEFAKRLNDVIDDGESARVLVEKDGALIQEFASYNLDDDIVIRDGYLFTSPNPTIIPPKILNRGKLSKAVQRKLNKL